MSEEQQEKIRVKHFTTRDPYEMTTYHKLRVIVGIAQFFATLFVPFVVIGLNEYLQKTHDLDTIFIIAGITIISSFITFICGYFMGREK